MVGRNVIYINIEFQFSNYDDYYFADPLVPYHVTVVAVNLAGPGEQEMKDFFTREGGMFPTTQGACMLFLILLPFYSCCLCTIQLKLSKSMIILAVSQVTLLVAYM